MPTKCLISSLAPIFFRCKSYTYALEKSGNQNSSMKPPTCTLAGSRLCYA